MKRILEKYYGMINEEKEDIEKLYIIHNLEKELKNHTNIKLNLYEEQILFNKVIECMKFSKINPEKIVSRFLEILEGADMTVFDIENLETNELTEILFDMEIDSQIEVRDLILAAGVIGRFYCILIKDKNKFSLMIVKSDGTHYEIEYDTPIEFLAPIVKRELLKRGEEFV